jgi:hypothetical protein
MENLAPIGKLNLTSLTIKVNPRTYYPLYQANGVFTTLQID